MVDLLLLLRACVCCPSVSVFGNINLYFTAAAVVAEHGRGLVGWLTDAHTTVVASIDSAGSIKYLAQGTARRL
jgi:hypothetical protein